MNIFVLSDDFVRLKNCLAFSEILMMADFKKLLFFNGSKIFYFNKEIGMQSLKVSAS